MSIWTNFRNSIEAILSPEISAAVSFGETVLANEEAASGGNVLSAFVTAEAAFTSAPGALEAKALAAAAAFATALIGEAVTVAKATPEPVVAPEPAPEPIPAV